MSKLRVTHAAYSEDRRSVVNNVYKFCTKKRKRVASDSLAKKTRNRTAVLTATGFCYLLHTGVFCQC